MFRNLVNNIFWTWREIDHFFRVAIYRLRKWKLNYERLKIIILIIKIPEIWFTYNFFFAEIAANGK